MSFAASTSTKMATKTATPLAACPSLRVRQRTQRQKTVCASLRHEELVAPTVAASLAASLIAPEYAQAYSLTPSLQALINSVLAGGLVAALILGAVTLVAGFDPIARD